MLILTDPQRTPDPLEVASRLPRGSGLVYRAFGAEDAGAQADRLATVARARDLVLLIGADARLAQACGADGLHLPERRVHEARRLRARFPLWRITAAAHGGAALRRARAAAVDAALLSPVFPSRSPSAGAPLGPLRAAALVRLAGLPVYALGGVDLRTVSRLAGTGFAGVAAVGMAQAVFRPSQEIWAP